VLWSATSPREVCAVRVECLLRGRVAETRLHHGHGLTLTDEGGRIKVPEGVEPGPGREPASASSGPPQAALNVPRLTERPWSSVKTRPCSPGGERGDVLGERVEDDLRQRYGAAGAFRFRRRKERFASPQVRQLLFDTKHAPEEVDMLDGEAKSFALTESGPGCCDDEGAIPAGDLAV
jgi:hypothetical protein